MQVWRACGDATAEKGDLVQRRVLADLGDALLVDHRVLAERRRALHHARLAMTMWHKYEGVSWQDCQP